MFIRIEKGSSTPISRQIAEQIRAQCLSGRIKPGTQIPSVRQLARDLAVNQNTVLRVYEKLMAEMHEANVRFAKLSTEFDSEKDLREKSSQRIWQVITGTILLVVGAITAAVTSLLKHG